MPSNSSTLTRLRKEQHFHDRQAQHRALSLDAAALRFDDDVYLDHATWLRPALAKLGPVRGRRILELGCGHGMAAIVLARRGAVVTALDLSLGYLREARARGLANNVNISWLQADGERLPFADASFDAVWGNAILHHLDPAVVGPEVRRILRSGGVAVFCEPWGGNPLVRWARTWLPYREKHRTVDEKPLELSDVETLRQFFPDLKVEAHEFLAMAARLGGPGRSFPRLARLEAAVLRRWPTLARWCRYVVLELRKST